MATFQVGKTYQTRSVCDSDCIIKLTVYKRTAKTIWTANNPLGKTLRVYTYEDVEYVKPWGSFSMAPMVSADRPV